MCACSSSFSSSGFSFDSKSAVPNSCIWVGTPTFWGNLTKLHSGTPTFLKKCPWDSCFENPSEKSGPELYDIIKILFLFVVCISDFSLLFGVLGGLY